MVVLRAEMMVAMMAVRTAGKRAQRKYLVIHLVVTSASAIQTDSRKAVHLAYLKLKGSLRAAHWAGTKAGMLASERPKDFQMVCYWEKYL